MRLDLALFEREITKSRTQAAQLIKEKLISVNGKIAVKPSLEVEDFDDIRLVGELPKYVSRGGLKLEKALKQYEILLQDCVCLDVGASTGGFTDCMLQNGARLVYAVDVGSAQLDCKLKTDPRVVSLENLDIRHAEISQQVNFISVDVSFISLKLILPELKRFLLPNGSAVVLIKPQFEAGKKKLGKSGVIKDSALQSKIAREIHDFAVALGFTAHEPIISPITGGDGNKEFLMYLEI